jgi:hypothetical protein
MDPSGLDTQFSVGVSATLFAFFAGGGGNGDVGITTDWTLSGTAFFASAQGEALGGLGLYAGVGVTGGASYTNGPLTSSDSFGLYGEADLGAGEAVGASTQIDSDGNLGASQGYPVKAMPGAGVGAMLAGGFYVQRVWVSPTWKELMASFEQRLADAKCRSKFTAPPVIPY